MNCHPIMFNAVTQGDFFKKMAELITHEENFYNFAISKHSSRSVFYTVVHSMLLMHS